ncbi:hypothetical protein [Tropicimonas sp.]|uniref:hypothetical protein n=1 Tax=Tropicimonas sp. TaxID=2067044 RepID=UPI003A8C42F6
MAARKGKLASRAAFVCFLGFGLATQPSQVIAQEVIQPAPISGVKIPDLSQLGEFSTIIAAPSVDKWQQVKIDASAHEVSDFLETAGWNEGVAAGGYEALSPDSRYSLYTRSIAAGVSDFLVVPEAADNMQPLEFKSAASSGIVQAAWWPGSSRMPSAKDIRDEIIEGMQAAIDSLCGMRARPREIKAKASAAGIVEIEATWMSADVCAAH